MSGLVELLWLRDEYRSLLSAVLLMKCLKARLWDDSRYVSKQLDGIGKYTYTQRNRDGKDCIITYTAHAGVWYKWRSLVFTKEKKLKWLHMVCNTQNIANGRILWIVYMNKTTDNDEVYFLFRLYTSIK